ncbi:MAG TPA: isochorismatase family protein [Phycisphaerae bacterium]|nr:isochorismatase family protein [Phycisphaerae bacterium]HRR83548.1 isochorismatase family protein [Phycisphaerae bacterium]
MACDGYLPLWNRVLLDVCTQRDFLTPGCVLQVANLDSLIANLQRVFGWVRSNGIAVVSLVESHRPTEPMREFPLHCIDNTPGQEKLPFTLLSPRTLVETDNYLSLPPDLQANNRQLIFRKRTRDILSNPKADRFLTSWQPEEYIIVGVGLERAIRGLALGLLARHKTVTVVTDACGCWSPADAELVIRQLGAKDIRLTTVEELTRPPVVVAKRTLLRLRRSRRHHPVGSRPAKLSSRAKVANG